MFCSYAFVDFETAEGASAAKNEHEGAEIEGRAISIEYGKKKSDTPARPSNKSNDPGAPTKTLIVRNLSYETTDDSLMEAFGTATAARVITDRTTGRSKG